MQKIEMWFPVAVYTEDALMSAEENEKIKQHCLDIQKHTPSGGLEWLGGTYNTHQTHNLLDDPVIHPLIAATTQHVHKFAKMHNCDGTYETNYAWMNISNKESWQEFHTHNANIFSAVYYPVAPEGSGRIIFEDPKEPDMFPLKSLTKKNTLSYSRISYTPTSGTLIIFRAYLRHCVEQGTNVDPRISIAMNFS